MNISSAASPIYSSSDLKMAQFVSPTSTFVTTQSSEKAESTVTSRPVTAVERADSPHAEPHSALSGQRASGERLEELGSESGAEKAARQRQELQEQNIIRQLASRDREVRAHEQAHAAVGGQYAGAPTYQFQRGPDGVNYAVGGQVNIDVSPASTPQETIRKMQIVRAAALAPIDPSPQDRSVAAQAAATLAQAQSEVAAQSIETSEGVDLEEASPSPESDLNGSAASAEINSQVGDTPALDASSESPFGASHLLSRSVAAAFGYQPIGQTFNQIA